MIKTILLAILGYYIGKGILGGILNFIMRPQDHDNPNPDTIWGNIGAVIGIILSLWLFDTWKQILKLIFNLNVKSGSEFVIKVN